jgi:hypothetical protein
VPKLNLKKLRKEYSNLPYDSIKHHLTPIAHGRLYPTYDKEEDKLV